MNMYGIDLAVHGDNYTERKADVREKAIDYQIGSAEDSLSCGEIALWQGYFTEQGKRYGLLKEFRENGIC